ncbi:transmembrane protein 186-like [Nomia melanderi]|uniref:transmembrane protein 186-like n=1 Tax=Nomia melanderi TaxID=2448451 RepID=UPI003FCCF021
MSKYCSPVSHNKRTYSTEINNPTKFPGYDVIYTFPYIRKFSVLNKAKRNLTVFTGVSTLTSLCLQLSDFIPTNECLLITGIGCTLTTMFHVLTFMCNNIIGFVYFKKEDKTIILSYSNYWGKRINFRTDIQNVSPLSETPLNVCSYMYRIVNIKSCKEKLKLSLPYGRIVKGDHFSNIFNVHN